jgi:hypothetical protein
MNLNSENKQMAIYRFQYLTHFLECHEILNTRFEDIYHNSDSKRDFGEGGGEGAVSREKVK